MAFKLKQGDEYVLPVKIRINGTDLPVEDVERVEFMTGSVRKTYPEEAAYDAESGFFHVRLTQEDTLSLPEDEGVRFDVRVKFKGGCVIGTQKVTVAVVNGAVSGEVI